MLVPILVVTEVAYLLASRVGTETEVRFLGDLAAGDLDQLRFACQPAAC